VSPIRLSKLWMTKKSAEFGPFLRLWKRVEYDFPNFNYEHVEKELWRRNEVFRIRGNNLGIEDVLKFVKGVFKLLELGKTERGLKTWKKKKSLTGKNIELWICYKVVVSLGPFLHNTVSGSLCRLFRFYITRFKKKLHFLHDANFRMTPHP
jgi:hypothetical protein